ncbi:MAG: Smr/MutS family protein [Myxococcales bacterium]|nr:Smr/MutS family protein [Myxococcales bacterium]
MLVTLIGTGTAIPVADRGPTSIWVKNGDTQLLIDCGSGTLQRFVAAGGDLTQLDGIWLSHAHLDHISDFPSLLFSLKVLGKARKKPLRVFHSKGMTRYLDGLRATFGKWLEPEDFQLTYNTLAAGHPASLGRLKLKPFEVAHHESSLGVRIESNTGEVLVVPSDTGLCQPLISSCAEADCVVIECSTTDDNPLDGHMNPTDVIYLGEASGVRSIIVTHQFPETIHSGAVGRIRNRADVRVVEATDGMQFEVIKGGVLFKNESVKNESRRLAREEALRQEMASLMSQGIGAFEGPTVVEPTPSSKAPTSSKGARRETKWTVEELENLRPNRQQERLLKQAERYSVPTLNLRGATVPDAMARLNASVKTWALRGVECARIVTGKGKRSDGDPAIKLAVINWLDGPDGTSFVRNWAPEIRQDGAFGSVVIQVGRK